MQTSILPDQRDPQLLPCVSDGLLPAEAGPSIAGSNASLPTNGELSLPHERAYAARIEVSAQQHSTTSKPYFSDQPVSPEEANVLFVELRDELAAALAGKEQRETIEGVERDQYAAAKSEREKRATELHLEFQQSINDAVQHREMAAELCALIESARARHHERKIAEVANLRSELCVLQNTLRNSVANGKNLENLATSAGGDCTNVARQIHGNPCLAEADAEEKVEATTKAAQEQERNWVQNFQRVRDLCRSGREQDDDLRENIEAQRQRLSECVSLLQRAPQRRAFFSRLEEQTDSLRAESAQFSLDLSARREAIDSLRASSVESRESVTSEDFKRGT